jgi:hypothetical protein
MCKILICALTAASMLAVAGCGSNLQSVNRSGTTTVGVPMPPPTATGAATGASVPIPLKGTAAQQQLAIEQSLANREAFLKDHTQTGASKPTPQ